MGCCYCDWEALSRRWKCRVSESTIVMYDLPLLTPHDGHLRVTNFPTDLGRYGELFSLQIDLLPAPSCVIPEVFGSLSSLKNVRANETHLVLVSHQPNAYSVWRNYC